MFWIQRTLCEEWQKGSRSAVVGGFYNCFLFVCQIMQDVVSMKKQLWIQ